MRSPGLARPLRRSRRTQAGRTAGARPGLPARCPSARRRDHRSGRAERCSPAHRAAVPGMKKPCRAAGSLSGSARNLLTSSATRSGSSSISRCPYYLAPDVGREGAAVEQEHRLAHALLVVGDPGLANGHEALAGGELVKLHVPPPGTPLFRFGPLMPVTKSGPSQPAAAAAVGSDRPRARASPGAATTARRH